MKTKSVLTQTDVKQNIHIQKHHKQFLCELEPVVLPLLKNKTKKHKARTHQYHGPFR